ncbi:MAG: HAD family hydrolase [Oscillospiraceae bacterium]|nr:HAD family hydrolase [Oscillospiraceae bacterium]
MDLKNTVFISDFDGTLLSSDKKLTDRNIEAIKKFRSLGGKFSVATGRPIQTIANYIDDIHYDLPMILCNGAMIYDPYEKEVVWAKYLPDYAKDIVNDILDKFPSVSPEVFTLKGQYYLRMNEVEAWHQALVGFDYTKVDSVDEVCEPICKLLFADDESVINELCEYVKKFENDDVRFVRSLNKFLELLPANVSKESGMRKLIELYGLDDCKLFSAGDYDNDIEMLKASDISFCPSDSQDCVKLHCDVVLNATCDEDAIAEAIDYLISK